MVSSHIVWVDQEEPHTYPSCLEDAQQVGACCRLQRKSRHTPHLSVGDFALRFRCETAPGAEYGVDLNEQTFWRFHLPSLAILQVLHIR